MGGKEQLSPSALSGLVGILKKMLELLPSSDSNLMVSQKSPSLVEVEY